MRISSLFLGASLVALATPAAAQTTTTRAGTQTPVQVEVGSAAPAQTAQPTTTLRDALVQAYNTNPGLQSERANQRANDENVPIAKAAGRPGLNGTTSVSTSPYDSDSSQLNPTRTGNVGLNLSVPIYTGGAVRNSVRGAETRVDAGRASLRGAEADLFTDAVTAYVDVLRFEAIVRLNQQNVHVLEVNLQATRDRFEVGDLTRTDVAQSEARLALAQSQLRTAEAALIGSRENYIRVIGSPPGVLAQPPALPGIPTDVQDAEQAALANNPNLEAAQKQRDATRFDVNAAKASRLPTVSIGVGSTYYNYLGSLSSQARSLTGLSPDGISTTLGAQVNLPLFQGGRPAAQIRQAQAREASAMETVTLTERGVIAQVRSAYANYSSALRVIESTRVAVEANRLSLEGVRAENSVGTRTILDILNAEQELLNSQVNYVTAERDAYVAGFQLLAAMGRAEANDLNLDGGPLYDPGVNYNRVKNRWSDWSSDPDPQAVGTSTKATPAQNPDVSATALDPVLQRTDATRPVDINRKKP